MDVCQYVNVRCAYQDHELDGNKLTTDVTDIYLTIFEIYLGQNATFEQAADVVNGCIRLITFLALRNGDNVAAGIHDT